MNLLVKIGYTLKMLSNSDIKHGGLDGEMSVTEDKSNRRFALAVDAHFKHGYPLDVYIKEGKKFIKQADASDEQLKYSNSRYIKVFHEYMNFDDIYLNEDGMVAFLERLGLRRWYTRNPLRLHFAKDFEGEEKEKALAEELADLTIQYSKYPLRHQCFNMHTIQKREFGTGTIVQSISYFDENEVVYMRRGEIALSDHTPVKTSLFLQALANKGYELVDTQYGANVQAIV